MDTLEAVAVTATQMASRAVVGTVPPQTVIRAEEAMVEEEVILVVLVGIKCPS